MLVLSCLGSVLRERKNQNEKSTEYLRDALFLKGLDPDLEFTKGDSFEMID